jgi:hypothetical protein
MPNEEWIRKQRKWLRVAVVAMLVAIIYPVAAIAGGWHGHRHHRYSYGYGYPYAYGYSGGYYGYGHHHDDTGAWIAFGAATAVIGAAIVAETLTRPRPAESSQAPCCAALRERSYGEGYRAGFEQGQRAAAPVPPPDPSSDDGLGSDATSRGVPYLSHIPRWSDTLQGR